MADRGPTWRRTPSPTPASAAHIILDRFMPGGIRGQLPARSRERLAARRLILIQPSRRAMIETDTHFTTMSSTSSLESQPWSRPRIGEFNSRSRLRRHTQAEQIAAFADASYVDARDQARCRRSALSPTSSKSPSPSTSARTPTSRTSSRRRCARTCRSPMTRSKITSNSSVTLDGQLTSAIRVGRHGARGSRPHPRVRSITNGSTRTSSHPTPR